MVLHSDHRLRESGASDNTRKSKLALFGSSSKLPLRKAAKDRAISQVFCIFYALFGVPLILITVADIGKFLSENIIWLYRWHARCLACPTRYNKYTLRYSETKKRLRHRRRRHRQHRRESDLASLHLSINPEAEDERAKMRAELQELGLDISIPIT